MLNNKHLVIEDITTGMKASALHQVTDEKVKAFSEISGDFNPIHLDEEFAKASRFGRRIAHGAMISSFFSSLFATELPGPGCIYVSQNTKFKKPVYINDEVFVEIEVIKIDLPRKRIYFSTKCFVNNAEVLDGEAEIYVP